MKEYLLNFIFRVITSSFVYWQDVCQIRCAKRKEISYHQGLRRMSDLLSNRGQQTSRMTTGLNADQE